MTRGMHGLGVEGGRHLLHDAAAQRLPGVLHQRRPHLLAPLVPGLAGGRWGDRQVVVGRARAGVLRKAVEPPLEGVAAVLLGPDVNQA